MERRMNLRVHRSGLEYAVGRIMIYMSSGSQAHDAYACATLAVSMDFLGVPCCAVLGPTSKQKIFLPGDAVDYSLRDGGGKQTVGDCDAKQVDDEKAKGDVLIGVEAHGTFKSMHRYVLCVYLSYLSTYFSISLPMIITCPCL